MYSIVFNILIEILRAYRAPPPIKGSSIYVCVNEHMFQKSYMSYFHIIFYISFQFENLLAQY